MTSPAQKKLDLHPIKVTQLIEIAPNVFLLSFNRSFSFVPGQVVALAMNPADQYRYYSIASGMLEAEVKYYLTLNQAES